MRAVSSKGLKFHFKWRLVHISCKCNENAYSYGTADCTTISKTCHLLLDLLFFTTTAMISHTVCPSNIESRKTTKHFLFKSCTKLCKEYFKNFIICFCVLYRQLCSFKRYHHPIKQNQYFYICKIKYNLFKYFQL